MASDPPETRRETPRKTLRARGQVAVPGAPVQSGTTIDIALNGVSIMLHEPVTAGIKCHIRFEFPSNGTTHVVQAEAKVVYCVCVGERGFRVGFCFSHSDPARARLISAL